MIPERAELGRDSKPFLRADFESGERKLLRDGHAANARVYLFRDQAGKLWTVKDFSARSFAVRFFLAPLLFWRETKIVNSLLGVDGVPNSAFKIDGDAVAVEFIPGAPLPQFIEKNGGMGIDLLEKMEDLMRRVHQAGVVHLDARGTGNWVVRPDGTPGLIDFQAALRTDRMPRRLRAALEDLDLSGVLKKWKEFQPEAMGEDRKDRLERGEALRRKWRIRGYLGLRK